MSRWMNNSAAATWVTGLIAAAIVLCYTIETRRMRKELMVQNTRAVLPFITVSFQVEGPELAVKNISPSPALNVTIDPVCIDAEHGMSVSFSTAYTLSKDEEVVLRRTATVNGQTAYNPIWDRNFFPHITLEKEWHLTIRFQTIEGKRYKQALTFRPTRKSQRPVEVSPVQSDEPSWLSKLATWVMNDSDSV